jgi:hypothetical protein
MQIEANICEDYLRRWASVLLARSPAFLEYAILRSAEGENTLDMGKMIARAREEDDMNRSRFHDIRSIPN